MASKYFCVWLLSLLIALANAAPTQQQVVFQSNAKPHSRSVFRDESYSMSLNLTFDNIDLTKIPSQTLDTLGFLDFVRFEAINTTLANATGMIAPQDIDCAASAPNAIRSIIEEYANPGIFRTNATALNAIGISEYFDLIQLTLKPLGPITADFIYTDLSAWTIDPDNRPVNVQELGLGWYVDEDGFAESWELEPRYFIEGWGEKVNWVEIGTYTEEGVPVMFSIDNILLGLHEL